MIKSVFELSPIHVNCSIYEGRVYDWEEFLQSNFEYTYGDIKEYMNDRDSYPVEDISDLDEDLETTVDPLDFDDALELYITDNYGGKWDKFLTDLVNNYDNMPDAEDFDEEICFEFEEAAPIIADNLRDVIPHLKELRAEQVEDDSFIFSVISEEELSTTDIDAIVSEMLGQASDGWGEGLEQTEMDGVGDKEFAFSVSFNSPSNSWAGECSCRFVDSSELSDESTKEIQTRDEGNYKEQLDNLYGDDIESPFKFSRKRSSRKVKAAENSTLVLTITIDKDAMFAAAHKWEKSKGYKYGSDEQEFLLADFMIKDELSSMATVEGSQLD